MSKKRVIIIGSGMGGLSCGVVLAKNGYDVTVLEQSAQIGGCLQCFYRHGQHFETGMHFIGSAGEGQTLDMLLRYLEVRNDLQLSALDTTAYDIVSLGDRRYRFPNGREAFLDQMSSYFPHQRQQLTDYFNLVERVASASTLHSLKHADHDNAINATYQLKSINGVIDSIITDPLLSDVLVGNLPLYAAEKDKTPFSTHAFIMDFYNQSAWRIVGGSNHIAASMRRTIERYGGRVLTRHKATRILCDDTHATGVEVNGDAFFPADYVISGAHPMRTLELIDSRLIRPAFRQRINSMPQTVGSFSLYLQFKEHTEPYMNSNYYRYNAGTPWGCEVYDDRTWPKGYLYMHFCNEPQQQYATTGVILSYMHMSEVEQWMGTKVGHRGAAYDDFKQQKAERLLESFRQEFPDAYRHIEHYYTSTPLTYRDYTGTEAGSMYGIARDFNAGAACRVPHRTKIPNVLQTGQNINSHGILGVIVGTIVTCSEFLTAQTIYEQIKHSL
jgi:all-trans-retinol 13,14-reductase